MKNLTIIKDNQLVNASYTLTLAETRIILLCISKIDSQDSYIPGHSFTITVDSMCSEFGIDRANAYRDLQRAVNTLYNRTIKIDKDDDDSEMRWIGKKAYFKSKGTVEITFFAEIMPLLTSIKNRFTSYKLKDVVNFTSIYSFRFYEALMQWKSNNELKISIQWIRQTMELENKYPKLADLKKYVIDSAIKDINEFSNLDVSYTQIKDGAVVTHLLFSYAPKCGVIDTKKPIKINKKQELSKLSATDHEKVMEKLKKLTEEKLKSKE